MRGAMNEAETVITDLGVPAHGQRGCAVALGEFVGASPTCTFSCGVLRMVSNEGTPCNVVHRQYIG